MDIVRPVDLHIERLVIDDASPAEGRRIGASVESELTRLLTERGLPSGLERGGDVGSLDGGSISRGLGDSSRRVGGRVAEAAYRSLKTGGR